LVFCECLNHVSNMGIQRPHGAWVNSVEVRFFRRFFQQVHVLPGLSVDDMIAATSARQRVLRSSPRAHQRELPSLTDAVLAYTATSDTEVALVVTDDADDFWQLAPEFRGTVEDLQSLLGKLGA
jgi:hypothetical protein